MTKLGSSCHSASSSTTINTRNAVAEAAGAPADELSRGGHASNTTTAAAKLLKGSSPPQLRQEAVAAQQQRRRSDTMTMTNESHGTSAAATTAGPSPSLSSSRLDTDPRNFSGPGERRQSSPLSNTHTPHLDCDGSQHSSIHSKDSATPRCMRGASSLPPLIPSAVGTAKDALLMELQRSPHHPLGSRVSSPSLATGQPAVSPEYSARRQQRSSTGSARDMVTHAAAGVDTSVGSFTLSPSRSTRDISATGLRGPIPENALFAAASQSPGSQSRSSRPTSTPTGPEQPSSGAAVSNSPRVADVVPGASTEAVPLPQLTRSLLSLSSSSHGRRLTGVMMEAGIHAATAAHAASASAAGTAVVPSRTSSMNSMRRDDEGPHQALHAPAVMELTAAVSQPLPSAPPSAAAFAPSPMPLPLNYNSVANGLRTLAPHSVSSVPDDFGTDGTVAGRQTTSRFTDEECETTANQQASPVCLAETEEVTFSTVPAITTGVSVHATLPFSTTAGGAGFNATTLTTTGLGTSHTSLPAPEVRAMVSATGSAVASDVLATPGESSAAMHEVADAARPGSGSIMKNNSGEQEHTAARGATEARRPSDSVTEAADPRAAKRRLKKAKKAKHLSSKDAAGSDKKDDNDRHHHHNHSGVVAAGHRSDSEIQLKRQRKKQEKQEKLKGMSTEERRRYKADHQRRRAAKKAQRGSNGASPTLGARDTGMAAAVQPGNDDVHPVLSSSSPIPSSPIPSDPPEAPPSAAAATTNATTEAHLTADRHSDDTVLDPLGATQPPISTTPESPFLKNDASNNVSSNNADDLHGIDPFSTARIALAITQSTPHLASTVRPGGNVLAGGATLLHALNQMRRCTSAKEPLTPVAMLSAAPPHGADRPPHSFRRRFLSEAAPTPTSQYPTNGFLCLPTNENTASQQQGQQQHEEAGLADSLQGGEKDFDFNDNNSLSGGEQRALYNRENTEGSVEESVVTSATAAPFIAPHPPPTAAGSGVAAICELKHQQQRQQQLASPISTHIGVDNATEVHHHDDDKQNEHMSDAPVLGDTAVEAASPSKEQAIVLVSVAPSVSFHAEPPADSLRGNEGRQAVLEEASHSIDSAKSKDGSANERHTAGQENRVQQQRSGVKNAASQSSLSYYTSYSRSQDDGSSSDGRSAHRPRDHQQQRQRLHQYCGRRSEANACVSNTAAIAGNGKLQQNAQRRRPSLASSCSSFRNRSGDNDSDIAGSSSYSYSYTSSTGSSSSSSTGSIMAEVLQLKEGCTTAPPTGAFQDLKYRYACVPQLQTYAEPAVIHEWNLTEGCWGSVETSVVLNPQPFSKGNMRASYYMVDMRRLNCMLVAKRYLKSSVGEDQYFDDVSMHSISGHWARVFNAMHPPKKVRFVPAAVLVLPKRNPPLILAMEPLLTGKFVKYNNNCGYVRRNARWTPQAFSHFTYQASNHELMVVDIQGVDDYYTDPQILSPDGEGYGRGNLGKKGIRRFLESHKCNDVCRAVGLPPLRRNSKGVVIAPLISNTKNGNGNSMPATPGALERLVAAPSFSGLKEERLPPKIHTLSQQSFASNNPHGSGGSPLLASSGSSAAFTGNNNGVHTRVGSVVDASRLGSEAVKLTSPPPPRQNAHSSPNSNAPSPSPTAASKGGSNGYNTNGNNNVVAVVPNNTNSLSTMGGSGSNKLVSAPPAGYSVKYVPHPRHAVVRPQSQYFTSTIAGGLMAVPPSSNAPGSLSPQAMQPPPLLQQQQQQHSPATPGAGGVVPAVPLLRPPAMGRPGVSSGGSNNHNGNGSTSGYAPRPSSASGSDGFVGVSAQKSGLQRLEPAMHPHPPKSRLSSTGGASIGGTPRPPSFSSVSGGGGGNNILNVSQTSSSIAVIPVVQTTQEVQIVGGPQTRRQSFSRRAVFSAVEEAKSKPKRHHRR